MPVIQYTSADGTLVLLDIEHVTAAEEDQILASARPKDRPILNRAFQELYLRETTYRAAATEEQQQIGWGDHAALRYEPPPGAGPSWLPTPCTIYGWVYTRDHARRSECAAAASLSRQGIPARPVDDSMAHLDAAHAAGWRFARWYSKLSPEGEPGEQHIATLIPVTAAQFRAARRDGWPDEIPPERP
jgi:hypothetical protein